MSRDECDEGDEDEDGVVGWIEGVVLVVFKVVLIREDVVGLELLNFVYFSQ